MAALAVDQGYNTLQVSTVYKYRNAACQIALTTKEGRLRKAALLRT